MSPEPNPLILQIITVIMISIFVIWNNSSFNQIFFVFFGHLQARISKMICMSSTSVSLPFMDRKVGYNEEGKLRLLTCSLL